MRSPVPRTRPTGSRIPLVPTARGWSLLVAAATTWGCWRLLGLGDLRYLAAFFAALVLTGVLWALAVPPLARFEVSVRTPTTTPVVGDRMALDALVRHRLQTTLVVRVVWGAGPAGGHARLRAGVHEELAVGRARHAVSRTAVRAGPRGHRQVGVTELRVTDPLGVATRTLTRRATVELLVLPRPLPALPDGLDPAGTGGRSGTGALGSAPDAGAPSGTVREYRRGDPLRRVHWKQSARQGELLVTVDEATAADRRSLRLVTAATANPGDDDLEIAVSAAAALALRWLRAGHPVDLYVDGTPGHVCLDGAEVLRLLALVEPAPAGAGRPGDRGSGDAAPGTPVAASVDVVVTGALTPALAADLATTRSGGTVLTASSAVAPVPPGWRHVALDAPLASRGPTSAPGWTTQAATGVAGVRSRA